MNFSLSLSLNPQPTTLNHPATNAGNFHQTIGPPVGRAAFFRLSTGSP